MYCLSRILRSLVARSLGRLLNMMKWSLDTISGFSLSLGLLPPCQSNLLDFLIALLGGQLGELSAKHLLRAGRV